MSSHKCALTDKSVFDYSSIQRDAADKARAAAERVRQRIKRSIDDIIHIGNELAKVKAVLGHGQFGKWLQAEFGWSDRLAEHFLSVAERFGPVFETFSDLTIQPSAAYLLAAYTVPDKARQIAISRAKAGETITKTLAKAIIAQAKGISRPPTEVVSGEFTARARRLLERLKGQCSRSERLLLVRLLHEFADALEKASTEMVPD